MDFERLKGQFDETIQTLERMWTEIGPEEGKDMKTELFEQMQQVYASTIKEVMEKKEHYVHDIQVLGQEIETLAQLVKEPCPEFHLITSDSLKAQLAQLQRIMQPLLVLKENRITQLSALKTQLYQLYRQMDESVPETWTNFLSDLSPAQVVRFQDQVNAISMEKKNRIKALEKLVQECKGSLTDLKLTDLSPMDHTMMNNPQDLTLSMLTIETLSRRATELAQVRSEREATLKTIGQQMSELWVKLKISQSVQDEFFDGVQGIGMDAIDACQAELDRMERLKKERLADLIREERQKIIGLWDIMGYSELARAYFPLIHPPPCLLPEAMNDDDVENNATMTEEDLLRAYEVEAEALEKRQETIKPLLKLIEKREKIIADRLEYEESLKDPQRLLGRKKRDTGRLLREEKLHSRIKKDLPKITEVLKAKIKTWEAEEDLTFLYQGENYLAHIEQVDRAYKNKKEEEKVDKEKKKKAQMKHEMTWGSTPRRVSEKVKSGKDKRSSSLMKSSSPHHLRPREIPFDNVCTLSKTSVNHSSNQEEAPHHN